MRSPTQRVLTRADLDRYAHATLGARVRAATELSGGSFAAVWRLDLDDGRAVVLKVGPAPETRLLRYEAGMIPAEAEYYRLVGGRALLEASGGITLSTVADVARTGVDLISSGALTHSAPSLDISLDFALDEDSHSS